MFFFRSRASWRWTSSSSTRAKGECFIFAAAFKMRRWPAAQPKVPCKHVKDLEKFFRKKTIEKTIQKLSNHGMFDDFCIIKLFFLCAKKQFGMTLDRFCNCSGWFPMILGLCLKDSRILVLGTVIDRTLNLSCQTKAVHPLRKSCPVIAPHWCHCIREGFVTEKLKQPINTPHGPWTMITYEYPPCRLNPSKLSLSPCFKRKGHRLFLCGPYHPIVILGLVPIGTNLRKWTGKEEERNTTGKRAEEERNGQWIEEGKWKIREGWKSKKRGRKEMEKWKERREDEERTGKEKGKKEEGRGSSVSQSGREKKGKGQEERVYLWSGATFWKKWYR